MSSLTLLLILIVYPNFLIANKKYSCLEHKTCRDCIRDSAVCDWCSSTNEEFNNQPRCRPKELHDAKWCSGSIEYIPVKNDPYPIDNRNFSSVEEVVQIKPQKYNIKLRPGQPEGFTFSFQGAKNYPVDLYMLLDASETMKNTATLIAKSSKAISETMTEFTDNLRMGFGTFIDKSTLPFKNGRQNTYSFKNVLNLTSDYKLFKKAVDDAKFFGNFDTPEGGFDALAQVMACKSFGWRDSSRKVIVFFTDSSHHVAGDGRSAGIFLPYDGKCYTDTKGNYQNELIMDYPSVHMLNKLASDREFTIIFAVNEAKYSNYEKFYDSLKKIVRGSMATKLNDQDIASQLKEIYKEISTTVVLKVVSEHKTNYDITFSPNCVNSDENLKSCEIESGKSLDFIGNITLLEYYKQDKEQITISVQGINETLTLNVEVMRCPCEGREEPSSEYCNKQKRQCGACICDKNKSGKRCMCDKGETNTTLDMLCIAPGDDITRLCSGKGECMCGLCDCPLSNLGEFCECTRSQCPGYQVVNNGSSECGQGKCHCGKDKINGRKEFCICDKDWTHRLGAEVLGCTCHDAIDSCITDANNTVCNGRGKCPCSTCECEPIAKWDKRIKQDESCRIKPCPACHSLQCTALRSCVTCLMNSENCTAACDGITIQKTYELTKEYTSSNEWSLCDHQKVNLGCYTKFVYKYDDMKYGIQLRMEETPNCAQNYYMYGGILLATILIVGILTILVWKGLTHYRDSKEFNEFEKQHKEILNRPCTNILYDDPTTTFRNPAFKRSING